MTDSLPSYLFDDSAFPHPETALKDPNGLLAVGGDLSPQRLYSAYSQGIFPWFSDGEPILWWSPEPRGVLILADYKPSRSLRKLARKQQYKFSINLAFAAVIDTCARIPRNNQPGTWINTDMQVAYCQLHEQGIAHSIEVWEDNVLIGGLYGVCIGQLFCGESMFAQRDNASKLAFWLLIEIMKTTQAPILDCQMQNDHLRNLGCIEWPRHQFLAEITNMVNRPLPDDFWQPGERRLAC